MKEKINIGRRSFTIGASIGLGAIITGLTSTTELLSQIQSYDKEKGAFSLVPNIWLEIKKDNTVIITIPRSEIGQGVRTSLSMITAEELDADWEKVKPINAVGDAKYGNQSTGGSTSIRVFWNTLRTAGAQVRLMLVSAAALTWKISESNCRTENGFVYEIGGNRSISYGELIDKASTLPIPDVSKIKLKDPSEFKLIGKTKWNIDNPEVVTGKAIFGSDYRIEGMKYAVVLRPPEIGGSLKSFDDINAKKSAGYFGAYQIPEGLAVVADSTYNAIQASELINANWNPVPISLKDSKIISDEMKEKLGKLPNLPLNNIKELEAVYEVPLLAHATMEPMSSFAHYKDNKCEIWTGTQNPQTARTLAAKAVDLPESEVTVNVLMSGGGFGRRHKNDYVAMAARISKLSGMPIKLQYTKADDIRNDYYRSFSVHGLKAGIDKNGKINGWIHKVISQGNVAATNPTYEIPDIQNLADKIDYSVPWGSWRSVNNTQVVFVNECFIDELAYSQNIDPLQFRLNMTNDDKQKNVLKLVAEKADWNRKLPKNWGRGISLFVGYGGYAAHVIEVSVDDFGILTVQRIVAALDCGIAINPGNIVQQFIGSAIDGLSTAIKSEITIKDGKIVQSGFQDFEWYSFKESPKIEVHIVPSAESPAGIGELGFPSISPALCNAIFDATKIRIRRLPIKHTSLMSKEQEISQKSEVNFEAYPLQLENKLSFRIDFTDKESDQFEIQLKDILGNKVAAMQTYYNGNSLTNSISIPNINPGNYIIIVKKGSKKYGYNAVKS